EILALGSRVRGWLRQGRTDPIGACELERLDMNITVASTLPLGLDVSKRTIDACLLLSDGQKLRLTIPNCLAGFHQLVSWLHGLSVENVHVCLEPTGRYSSAVALFLHTRGYRISQVNSYAVLHHGRSKNLRSKTDRIDAYLLADYCLKENPPVWVPAEQSQSELRDIQGRLSAMEEMIRQEENRLEAGLDSPLVRLDIEEHIAQLLVRKRHLETAAKDLVRTNQSLNQNFAILTSIIGIGEVSAIRMLALIRFQRFDRGRQVACFAGMTPKKYESGTSIHKKEHISRRGNNELREALYFPAMVAMQHNPQLRAFADRLRQCGKAPKVIICAVMRKLLVLAAALIRKQEFYDPTKGIAPA